MFRRFAVICSLVGVWILPHVSIRSQDASPWVLPSWKRAPPTGLTVPLGPPRTLHFSADRSMGKLFSVDPTQNKVEPLGEAKGTVEVPGGLEIWLQVEWDSSKDLTPLASLEADDIYSLDLSASMINDAQLEKLSGLTGLKLLQLNATAIKGEGLKHLGKLTQLEFLNLNDTPIGDDALVFLKPLVSLKQLFLSNTQITDQGLANLVGLPALESLNLRGTRLGNDGLAHLAKLGTLKDLTLSFTEVGDPGLAHLTSAPSLERVDLSGLGIHDGGLAQFNKLTTLKWLGLDGTQVTPLGVRTFAKVQPGCYMSSPFYTPPTPTSTPTPTPVGRPVS